MNGSVKRVVATAIIVLLCAGAFIAGFLSPQRTRGVETARYMSENVEVVSISKDSYEIADDGTVLIFLSYRLRNTGDEALCVSVGGIFRTEKAAGFLEEELLIADEPYVLEPGEDTWISVVLSGRNGANPTMPDRLPPDPYVVECDSSAAA